MTTVLFEQDKENPNRNESKMPDKEIEKNLPPDDETAPKAGVCNNVNYDYCVSFIPHTKSRYFCIPEDVGSRSLKKLMILIWSLLKFKFS